MREVSELLVFVGACVALVAIPGPAAAFIVARSIGEGIGAGVRTAAGVAVGNLCQALGAAFGLAAALKAFPIMYQGIKYAGAGYLMYLGMRAFLRMGSNSGSIGRSEKNGAFRQGGLVGLLNPKVSLFLLAFLPQFTDPERGAIWLQLLSLGLGFVLIGWVGDSVWALCAGWVGQRFRRKGPSKWARVASGTVYCILGLATAFWLD